MGLTLGLFYHMKITFKKEMFLLNGVIDLCSLRHSQRLGELTAPHMTKIC